MAVRHLPVTVTIVATIVGMVTAGSIWAESLEFSEGATGTAMASTALAQARERPRGPVLDCSRQSGLGGAPSGTFTSRRNLIVGPLAMLGAAAIPASSGFGNKFPVVVKGGHRVTVEVSRAARPGAGLIYGQGNFTGRLRDGYRVLTFIACRRGEMSRGSGTTAWPMSFWAGGLRARSPRCVPLFFWVDDEPKPRRAVIYLGLRACA